MKVGDVVELKSGGPQMTIESIYDFGGVDRASCVWFDGTERKEGNFPVDTLKKSN